MALRWGHGAMMGKLHGLIDEPIIEAFFFFFFLVPTETVMALVTALGRFVGSKGCYSP